MRTSMFQAGYGELLMDFRHAMLIATYAALHDNAADLAAERRHAMLEAAYQEIENGRRLTLKSVRAMEAEMLLDV